MEITTSRKKTNGNVGHWDLDVPNRNQYSFSKSIKNNEKMVEEMQQQMLELERKITEKKMYHEKASMSYRWIYNRKWASVNDDQDFRSYCRKKMELDKKTFANSTYRDKKTVTSFSSGKREINIHNLNHRMLHEAQSIDGERRLLKMLNPSKDDDSEFSLKQIEEQVWKLYCPLKWPQYNSNTSALDVKECERKLRELEAKRDQVFVNAPCKASLWISLPSTEVLRNEIQAMETIYDEKRKMFMVRRKKIESEERNIKKTEKEIKSMNKKMEMISNRKQRALKTISHGKELCSS